MTTNTAPAERAPRVLLAAAVWTSATTIVLAVTGALAQGRVEAVSALVGGGTVLLFFVFGAVVVGTASRLAPQTALLIAMLTYTFQVALVALVFAGLTKADVFESDLSEGWLAAALILGTFAWMGGQLTATLRAPIAPWEGAEDGGTPEELPPGVSGREVGAA